MFCPSSQSRTHKEPAAAESGVVNLWEPQTGVLQHFEMTLQSSASLLDVEPSKRAEWLKSSAENKYCTTQQQGSLTQLVIMFMAEQIKKNILEPCLYKADLVHEHKWGDKGSLRKAWCSFTWPDLWQAENLEQMF